MSAELSVELSVDDPGACPVANASRDTAAPVSSVSRAAVTDDGGRVPEQFTTDGRLSERHDVTEIAAYETRHVYRFRREPGAGCVCEQVEAFGYPITDIRASDGTLHLSFHVPSLDTVEDIVTALRETYSDVSLRKLVRTEGSEAADLVFVDRRRLTDRQQEVLETAHEMGYFDYPKEANAGDVADALDISASTFSEHLAAAQRKLLDAILKA
ncbi:helix-turn-helix domain-containing protein [Halarchaeum sp. P4]|uniref:helix-turn-helix domain-containing protein n=1 Tax=Halarchaeum sp. P4 TaxID=3421639 RepID=UPI003EB7DFF8